MKKRFLLPLLSTIILNTPSYCHYDFVWENMSVEQRMSVFYNMGEDVNKDMSFFSSMLAYFYQNPFNSHQFASLYGDFDQLFKKYCRFSKTNAEAAFHAGLFYMPQAL